MTRFGTINRPSSSDIICKRGDQVFKIQKRLARTHSDEIRAVRRFGADAVNVVEDDDDLLDDLADGQISQQAELCRQAKIAF